MEVRETDLADVYLVEPHVFDDSRGFFMETYHKERYAAAGIKCQFVQDNYSRSCRGSIRGLHYQIRHPQGKLVQVVRGEIFDVVVDLRRNSPRFGRWVGVNLSESNRCQLYVPPGFAHGFCVLSDVADFFYKCSDLYYPEHDRTLLWNDTDVNIDWPLDRDPILSEKDRQGVPLIEAECYD